MQKNEIFMVTCNMGRLKIVDDHFLCYHSGPHSMNINIIVDDLNLKKDDVNSIIAGKFKFINGRVILMSEMIDFCKPILNNPKNYDALTGKIYRVSAKLLVFIYAKYKLGINKSFMIDDDVFILKPIDHLFQYDVAVKKDGLSSMRGIIKDVFAAAYGELFSDNFSGSFLNSGTILYTWNDEDDLVGHVRTFFDTHEFFALLGQKYYNGSIGGSYWIFEQYCYAVFFHGVWKKRPVYMMKAQDVEMQTAYLKGEPTPYRNPPAIIHVVLRNKTPNNTHIMEKIRNDPKAKKSRI